MSCTTCDLQTWLIPLIPLVVFPVLQQHALWRKLAIAPQRGYCLLKIVCSKLSELSNDEGFEQCIVLTDRVKEEQYDMDLALRFVVFRTLDAEEVKRAKDINEFVTDQMLEIARNPDFDFAQEAKAFKATFSILNETIGADCFHRYDIQKQRFLGGFLLSAFEAVGTRQSNDSNQRQ